MQHGYSIVVTALLALPVDGQTKLGSFRAPPRARGWIDAPRTVLTELGWSSHDFRAAVDLDGDGRLEFLALRTQALAPIVVVHRPGPDVFVAAEPLGVLQTTRVLGVGDLIGSSLPDLVTDDGSTVTGLIVHRNAGGHFAPPIVLPTPGYQPHLGAMSQADLDPRDELLVAFFDTSGGAWANWWDVVGGSFTPGPLLSLTARATSAAAIDVDGDGTEEVLLALGLPGEVWVVSMGSGRVALHRSGAECRAVEYLHLRPCRRRPRRRRGTKTPSSPGAGPSQVNGLQVLENMGTVLVARPLQLVPDPTAEPVLADWDGDGDLDLMGGFLSYGQAENVGGLTFRPAGTLACLYSRIVAVDDVNEDGYPDLVTPLGAWHGNGRFEDSGRQVASTMDTARAIDLEGDGDLDVLERGFSSPTSTTGRGISLRRRWTTCWCRRCLHRQRSCALRAIWMVTASSTWWDWAPRVSEAVSRKSSCAAPGDGTFSYGGSAAPAKRGHHGPQRDRARSGRPGR